MVLPVAGEASGLRVRYISGTARYAVRTAYASVGVRVSEDEASSFVEGHRRIIDDGLRARTPEALVLERALGYAAELLDTRLPASRHWSVTAYGDFLYRLHEAAVERTQRAERFAIAQDLD